MDIISRIFRKKYTQENPRVKIQNFHKITIMINDEEYEVYNVSLGGIGFLVENNNFKTDEKYNAVVKVLDQLCDIEVLVRHHTKDLVGCSVEGSCEVYQDFVKEYFNSELEALKLRKISRDKMNDDENGDPHWFYGDYNHEIYFTSRGEDITTLHINYHGYMFIFDNGKSSTGLVWEDSKEEISHKSANLIQQSNKLPKDIMEFMYRFVESVEDLEPVFKKQIMSIMNGRFGIDWQS